MFALGINYLMGWAMAAADGAKKERAEWPPHPDRVFMALAAAWFETGQDVAEGEALRWLENLGKPPQIRASKSELREPVEVYVPVNDTSTPFEDVKKGKLASSIDGYSLGRPRRGRTFPIAIPHDSNVYLSWQVELPEIHRKSLTTLCRKVSSIGHSASLVQMWVEDNPPLPNLIPRNGVARHRLRVFGPGRLRYLEERCNRTAVIEYLEQEDKIKGVKGKDKKPLQDAQNARFPDGRPVTLRPEPGLWQGYDDPKPPDPAPPRGSIFDPRLVVLALSGKRLSLPSTLKVTEALRGALLAACPAPIPEWLSGHTPDGMPSKQPHISILPLPFTGSSHADGRLMALALALPAELDAEEIDRVLTPWLWDEQGEVRKNRLFDGQWLECTVALETRESPPVNMRPETWTEVSRQWATVTPVVLDRHFDGPGKWEKAAESLKIACERIGLPRPASVLLHPVSMIEGVPRSNEFPWISRKKDGGRRHHAHAVIVFAEDVQGPVIVGAGRFRGYGFCRPLRQGGSGHA